MSVRWKFKVLLKRIATALLSRKTNLVSDERYTAIIYRIIFGRRFDINCPHTYNEYLSVLKLNSNTAGYAPYADKYEVRKYVEKTIGGEYLNPLLGIYNTFKEINFTELPRKFALKCTHGSSYNIIVKNKDTLNLAAAERKITRWLKQNYYYKMREKQYKNIRPRIMCDQYLCPVDESPLNEVKLYCINGIVRFIVDNHKKENARYANLYDRAWNRLDVTYGFPRNDKYKSPENAQEIVSVAEKLAKPFEFVRVDLYNVDNKIIFSELTFCPGGGMVLFNPDSFDYEMGNYFALRRSAYDCTN